MFRIHALLTHADFHNSLLYLVKRNTPTPRPAFPAGVTHRVVGGDHLLEDLGLHALGLQVGVLVVEVEQQQGGAAVGAHEPGAEGQDALLQVGHWRQATQLLEGHDGVLRGEADQRREREREEG